MRTVWTVLVAIVVAGCGPQFLAKPDLAIPLADNEFGEFTLLIYDSSDLVVAAVAAPDPADGTAEPRVVALPETGELLATWTGGACSHRPLLMLTGDASNLRLVLHPDAPDGLPFAPVECPAVGLIFGVILSLSAPVGQDAVELEVK